ncbi:MAG: sulfatase-like hydrolase/transferase [Planctomycetota bacterium]|nr:sulfatase-like hydrolase/transferase [Planctomycetota bacterium]
MLKLSRRNFLAAIGSGAAAMTLPGLTRRAEAEATAPAPDRPNIILAMTDDQGWADVGYNSATNSERAFVKTPVMDEMAAAGLRFNRFYAQAPLCSPTRGSVMTGRHPFRYGTFSPGSPFRVQEMTIAQALKSAGYATGHFGKWHLNGVAGPGKPVPADDPLNPGRFGFDEWFSVSNFFGLDWTFSRKGEEVKTAGDGSDVIVAEALKFIRQAAADKKPFLAVIWYGSPHLPIDPLPEYKEKAGGSPYYGEIYGVDHSLGTLRAELRKLGVADNTLLWFNSDNGGVPKGSTGNLRGRKSSVWEGGLRVPGIIEWPARIRKPAITDVPAVTSDIYPTVLDFVGVKVPGQIEPLDGISIRPLIEGKMAERPKPIAFWHGGKGVKDTGHAALTDNTYKLHKLAGEKYELYDLIKDPAEEKDLAAEKPEIVARMKPVLEAWQDSVVKSLAGGDYPPGTFTAPPAAPAEAPKKAGKKGKKAAGGGDES